MKNKLPQPTHVRRQHGRDGASSETTSDRSQVTSRPEPLTGHPTYCKIRDLNWGSSGFVQLARNTQTHEQVAIKFISRGRQNASVNMQEISRELLNQRMCSHHPNIVQLREVFLTSEYLAVAMEFADGGDLSEFIDAQFTKGVDFMAEDDARWIFQQLIVAVDYCHRLGIANRDIKLDNMLLSGSWPRPTLKVCDFGFSKNEVVQSVSKSTCGTPEYMAPEVLFESKYNGQDADVWSCGVSLYVLLTGVFPFSRPNDEGQGREGEGGNMRLMRHMFRRIIAGNYWPVPELSAEAQHLIHHIFRPNPAERCTTEDIMAHPWFTRNMDPDLASLNNRLMAAKQAEHRACQQSIRELERNTRRYVQGGLNPATMSHQAVISQPHLQPAYSHYALPYQLPHQSPRQLPHQHAASAHHRHSPVQQTPVHPPASHQQQVYGSTYGSPSQQPTLRPPKRRQPPSSSPPSRQSSRPPSRQHTPPLPSRHLTPAPSRKATPPPVQYNSPVLPGWQSKPPADPAQYGFYERASDPYPSAFAVPGPQSQPQSGLTDGFGNYDRASDPYPSACASPGPMASAEANIYGQYAAANQRR